jgi:hypothetical protein
MASSGTLRRVAIVGTEVPPYRRFLKEPHGVTSQKTFFFILCMNCGYPWIFLSELISKQRLKHVISRLYTPLSIRLGKQCLIKLQAHRVSRTTSREQRSKISRPRRSCIINSIGGYGEEGGVGQHIHN